jgi:hypothetical protein
MSFTFSVLVCGGDKVFGGSVDGIGDERALESGGELKTTGSANVNMMMHAADGQT